ncbi:DUF2177 family protein [Fusibacter bizertensis]|jgi:Predicted membrane protein|uniref:DUF2177 family protein n=1 Tax=Fusibacter bizertensis TaxID=1488331 RepID=A0ABT6NA36_9FIRM|nr:DUF2177 family protein [Fusibacter bizertensis]MDH8677287.1 DUF2177 family protein [Fusibacter bizertensis]
MAMVRNFFITFVVFLVIDMFWLGFVAKNIYSKYLGYLMADKVNWIAAIVFYMLFVIGLLYFVIMPANDFTHLVVSAALFGLITYATYDLTNLATVKSWPLTITFIDLVWGTVLSTLTATVSYLIIGYLDK